jgi:rubrerythrin
MNLFNAHDIVRFAVRIEEDGELFYRKAALIIAEGGPRDLFEHLAAEEVGHKKIFEGILESLGDYRPPETYDGEYVAYLRDFIDGKAVFRGDAKDAGLSNIRDTLSAIDFAIQREIDSIVYYQEIRLFVPEKHHKIIDAIIAEERKHFSKLSEIRKSY